MMWDGQWFWGAVMMLSFWGASVALVYLAIRNHERGGRTARDVLDERFARGELSPDEYRTMRAELDHRPGDGS